MNGARPQGRNASRPNARVPVPAILRFLLIIGVIVGLVWGAMLALVSFVQPEPREMTQTLAPNRLNK